MSSWSLYPRPKAKKEDFDAAVDAAPVTGQNAADAPGLADDVAAAKAALKLLAARVKHPVVLGSASGHCLEPGQDLESTSPRWHDDGISVSVSGVEKKRHIFTREECRRGGLCDATRHRLTDEERRRGGLKSASDVRRMKLVSRGGGRARGRKLRAAKLAWAAAHPPKPPPRVVHLYVINWDLTSPYVSEYD